MNLSNYSPDFLNVVGDDPVAFDWIGRQTLRGIAMTGIHSTIPHGLKVGDRIKIQIYRGNWLGEGVYDVQAIADTDDGSYNGTLIVIHQFMNAGESASGIWQKVPSTYPLTPYKGGGNTSGTTECGSNQVRIDGRCYEKCPEGQLMTGTGQCVTPDPGSSPDNDEDGCPTGYVKVGGQCTKVVTAGFSIPTWAQWVALAAGAGILLWGILKNRKK